MSQDIFLHRPAKGLCWICGSSGPPSREHKIKASDIRRKFGKEAMVVSAADEGIGSGRTAQGPNSTYLKYESTICQNCNSSVTQDSDRAYEEFIQQLENSGSDEEGIKSVIADPKFSGNSPSWISLCRYFGKLLGCHLADSGYPIPLYLSKFVLKEAEGNCILLSLREDVAYQELSIALSNSNLSYAAHGGLVVITKMPDFLPSRFHTTLAVGRIQFIFQYILSQEEILEMRSNHKDFIRLCIEVAKAACKNPIPQADLDRLGL